MGHALEVQVPSDTPAGSAPAVTAQVYGVVPPLTGTDPLYTVPTVPFGSDEVVVILTLSFSMAITRPPR
jgi:hypothetical protein